LQRALWEFELGSIVRGEFWSIQERGILPPPCHVELGNAAITRLVGAFMLEQNGELAVTRRYMNVETVRGVFNDTTMDAAQIASI
jgi:hypothetical protein